MTHVSTKMKRKHEVAIHENKRAGVGIRAKVTRSLQRSSLQITTQIEKTNTIIKINKKIFRVAPSVIFN